MAGALAVFGLTVPSAAAAAETYSAPLSTAVQQLAVAAENNAGYDRDVQFGDWIDADGDCQNTRDEVLVVESHVAPTLSATGCTVTAGQWPSIYDGQTYTSPSEVDIDPWSGSPRHGAPARRRGSSSGGWPSTTTSLTRSL